MSNTNVCMCMRSKDLKLLQWNSAITTTLKLFIKCRYSKGCRYFLNREQRIMYFSVVRKMAFNILCVSFKMVHTVLGMISKSLHICALDFSSSATAFIIATLVLIVMRFFLRRQLRMTVKMKILGSMHNKVVI